MHVLPIKIEEAKKADTNKLVEENKGKSKAGSTLPKEPVQEDSKAGSSLVPNSVNQVKRFDRFLKGVIV